MQSFEQADAIGKQFAQHYYNAFKTDRTGLGRLYQPESALCWEGKRLVGQQQISQHFTSLPFGKIDFNLGPVDCQPSVSAGVLVLVTGQLITEGETQPLKFSQTFHLSQASGAWMITNDIFRLNYA